MRSKPPNILSLTRFAAVEARSSQRATVLRERLVTLAVAERLAPSTRSAGSLQPGDEAQIRLQLDFVS